MFQTATKTDHLTASQNNLSEFLELETICNYINQ